MRNKSSKISKVLLLSSLVSSLASALASPAGAETLPIDKETQAQLGFGINPLTLQNFERCLDTNDDEVYAEDAFDPKSIPTSGLSIPVSVEQITSYSQMDRYSSESVSAKAHYAFASGGFNYASQSANSLFSDRAAVGIEAGADYGRWYLKSVKLMPEFAELAKKDLNAFYERCGTEYVAGYRIGQGIRVMMMTSLQITKSYEAMQASVQASVEFGKAGGGFAGSFMNAAASLLKTGTLQVQFSAYGGGKLSEVSPLIKTEADAGKFRDLIAEYLGKMTPAMAIKTHYITKPYFPGKQYDPLLTEVKRQRIQDLYADFRMLVDNQARLSKAFESDRITAYLSGACQTPQRKEACENYIQGLKTYQAMIDKNLEDVRAAVRSCVHASSVQDCKPTGSGRWDITNLNQIIWPAAFRYQLLQAKLDDVRSR